MPNKKKSERLLFPGKKISDYTTLKILNYIFIDIQRNIFWENINEIQDYKRGQLK